MMTAADYRANFAEDYGQRTAGAMPEASGLNFAQALGATDAQAQDVGFIDMLKNAVDIINPLQHIPVVNTVYRMATGDQINEGAKIAGDTIYGGVAGAIISIANSFFNFMSDAPEAEPEPTAAQTAAAINTYAATDEQDAKGSIINWVQ